MHRLSDRDARALLTLTPALTCLADPETGHFTWVGPAWTDLLGWSQDELLARPFMDWVHPDDLEATLEATKDLQSEGHKVFNFVNRYRRKSGGWVHLAWHATSQDGQILAVATDITGERLRAREAEERTRLLQMAEAMAKVGHWRVDLGDMSLFWSDQVYRIHGRHPSAGPPPMDEAINYYHPDDRERVQDHVQQAITEGKGWDFELRLIAETGEERRVMSIGTCERDEDGEICAITGVFQDVTTNRRMQEKLQDAERLSSITTLAAGIAHELNNPLQYLSANVSMALENLQPVVSASKSPWAREQLEYLEDAEHAVDQVARIVQDLRVFMRSDDERAQARVNLGSVLATTVSMTRAQLQTRADVSTSMQQLPDVIADHSQLIQVFINLLTNAADALNDVKPGTGRVRISSHVDRRGFAVVEVEDNGPGIPPDLQKRVFEPFFTTKDVGVGTGLGLHVSRSIVQKFGGDIELVSRPGFTLFRVSLPPAPEAILSEVVASDLPSILVIDDDLRVARTIARLLRRDYESTIEGDPRAAVKRIASGERFDLVLSDINMPLLSGWDFLKQGVAHWPELEHRILMMTGASTNSAPAEYQHLPVIAKPFKPGPLLDALAGRLAWKEGE